MCGCNETPLSRDGLLMCAVCPWIKRSGASAEAPATCSVDGVPVLAYQGRVAVASRPCPAGRHADKDGVVRWLGIRWYGVPMPIRLWLRYRPLGRRLRREVSGCGCIVVLKDWWRRAAPRWATKAV